MPQTPQIPISPEKKPDSASKVPAQLVPSIVTLKPVASQNKKSVEAIPTTSVDTKPIYVYQDLIQPIFEKRCYSCHNATKVKGGLRLDSPEFIRKGGDNGLAMIPGDPDNSYIYGSLVLPIDDDYHMPPDGKPQLTPEQIQRIHWWILKGGSFEKTAQEMAGSDIIPVFIELPKQDTIK
jgi:Planctomycete cytochrome C